MWRNSKSNDSSYGNTALSADKHCVPDGLILGARAR